MTGFGHTVDLLSCWKNFHYDYQKTWNIWHMNTCINSPIPPFWQKKNPPNVSLLYHSIDMSDMWKISHIVYKEKYVLNHAFTVNTCHSQYRGWFQKNVNTSLLISFLYSTVVFFWWTSGAPLKQLSYILQLIISNLTSLCNDVSVSTAVL